MAKLDKLVEQARAHLEPGEQIEAAVLGAYDTKVMGQSTVRNGVMLATDRRLVFFAKKLGGHDLESFPYANISSFESSKGLMGHSFRFAASGNDVSLKWINTGDVARFAELLRARAGQRPAATAVPSQPDPPDQLRKLAELRDAGIVTAKEFEAKKRQLLGL
ncbi:PH domain-containing protein [Micromonospora sp. CPCC 205556]|uniref:PH domain-containing protein n=1 Tax=Micromonospora sp. CPCC 205556 TaxID=3122398 RepID=UPI002FF421D8